MTPPLKCLRADPDGLGPLIRQSHQQPETTAICDLSGGWFPVPHGVICGTLMAAAQRQNWSALQQRDPHHPAVERMARVGRLMPGGRSLIANAAAVDHLTESLLDWVEELKIPRLGNYGITAADLDRVVEAASNRNNPIALTPSEIKILLQTRL